MHSENLSEDVLDTYEDILKGRGGWRQKGFVNTTSSERQQ